MYIHIYIYTHTHSPSDHVYIHHFLLLWNLTHFQQTPHIYNILVRVYSGILYPHGALVNLPTYPFCHPVKLTQPTESNPPPPRRLVVGLLSTVSITADLRPSLALDVQPFLCWDLPSMVICCPNVTLEASNFPTTQKPGGFHWGYVFFWGGIRLPRCIYFYIDMWELFHRANPY